MKKLLISLFVISAVLLSSTYFVGEMTEKAMQKIFAKSVQQGLSSKLISYDKQFLKATVISQITLAVEQQEPVVFTVTSVIQHYPYKALINNEIRLLDPELAAKVQRYFSSANWISSREELSLLGQLTGQLQLLPGRYGNAERLFSTKALQLDYQVNLHNDSGLFNLHWDGLAAQTSAGNFSVESVKLKSNFSAVPVASEYDYFAEIAKVVIRQKDSQAQMQGIELQGSSRPGDKADSIDSSNDWKVASYRIAKDEEKLFTDNHLQLDIKGLYYPALTLLNHASDNPQQVERALAELISHGARLNLEKLTSQTPWGEVEGALDITLEPGAILSEIAANPFMLLDYTSGHANLSVPEALLLLPALSELLTTGLRSGFLKRQEHTLRLETQFEQGELTVNGREIPL